MFRNVIGAALTSTATVIAGPAIAGPGAVMEAPRQTPACASAAWPDPPIRLSALE